jgi:hypothetical protein
MAKIAVVILSGEDNPARATSGLRVARRLHDTRQENGLEAVEVFLFTGGVRLLSQLDSELGQLIREAAAAGILVGGCTAQINEWNLRDSAEAAGVRLEFASQAFARFARDGYTVLTF